MRKKKYLQIFNYLKEFSKIRSKPVRDIEIQETQYPEKLWLDDIPENELFENIIRPEFNTENDYWLKIRKPKEPEKISFNKLSENLEAWIEPDSLLNENEEPILKELIIKDEIKFLKKDYPKLEEELKKYINLKWLDDLIEYNEKINQYNIAYQLFERLNHTYKKLFKIFNKTQRFGEEYELVIGVGLLNFKAKEDDPKIFRHIITQRADIEFKYSKKDYQIYVSPNPEAFPQIETDSIIDLEGIFDPQNIIEAEKAVENFIKEKEIYTLFDESLIEEAIQMFAERVAADGHYSNSIEKPSVVSVKPSFYYSPALLLRKRNTRSFTALYENIIDNIDKEEHDIDVPILNDLIGMHENIDSDHSNLSILDINSENNPIYFPKEWNDEQIEIVEKSRRNNKVLVQGPPGTGKSHTIANLICHILANGQKVLVTAYTKRALEVLKEKLPLEFQNLVVNLLSSDSSSIQDLKSSVNTINDELTMSNLQNYKNEIADLEQSIKILREKIAFNTNELIKIKEKSSRQQKIGDYSGTLTKIAKKLEEDNEKYKWYKDAFCNIDNNDIYKNLGLFINMDKHYKNKDVSQFKYLLPELKHFQSPKLLKEYKNLNTYYKKHYLFDEKHKLIKCSDYNKLENLLKQLKEYYNKLDKIQVEFKQKIIATYDEDKASRWKKKLISSIKILNRIETKDIKQM